MKIVVKVTCEFRRYVYTEEEYNVTICYNKEVHKRHALLYVALITNQW